MSDSAIYALSTVFGKSGVAVIRISGNEVLHILSKMTDINIATIKPRRAYFCTITKKESSEPLDKAIVLYFKSPHSYTGEDIVEFQFQRLF